MSPTDLPPPAAGNGDRRLPYPNPGWARLVSFLLAVALSGLILTYPKAFASSISEVHHGLLALVMWGIAAGFVHGVGFVPRLTVWRAAFHPFVGWALMVAGAALTLAA